MGQKTAAEFQELLEAPFPKEAMSKDGSRGFDLTSIKAQWVVDRLNSVFGIWGWDFKPSFEQVGNHIVCHGVLTVTWEGVSREVAQTGSHEIKKNVGDAYKSASTDCLGKAASWIGIGNDVFKGNIDPRTLAPKANTSAQAAPQNKPRETQFIPPSDKQKSFYFSLLKGKYGSTEAIPGGVLTTARQLGKMAMAQEIDKMQKEVEGE